MTTNSIHPLSTPVKWDELIRWITDQLSAIPFQSAPIPESWRDLITWLITELEASFGNPKSTDDNEKWESLFRDAHDRAKETLDAGAERVINHIREMPSAARAPAAVWWKVAWEKIMEFFTKMVNFICDVGRTMWDRVKAWFARIKEAFARLWARCSSKGRGQ